MILIVRKQNVQNCNKFKVSTELLPIRVGSYARQTSIDYVTDIVTTFACSLVFSFGLFLVLLTFRCIIYE